METRHELASIHLQTGRETHRITHIHSSSHTQCTHAYSLGTAIHELSHHGTRGGVGGGGRRYGVLTAYVPPSQTSCSSGSQMPGWTGMRGKEETRGSWQRQLMSASHFVITLNLSYTTALAQWGFGALNKRKESKWQRTSGSHDMTYTWNTQERNVELSDGQGHPLVPTMVVACVKKTSFH